MAINNINSICDRTEDTQKMLQLFDDRCLKIIDGADAKTAFCLNKFAFPVDGHSCISIDIESEGGEIVLFNNDISIIGSPADDLSKDQNYVRGILLNIEYPSLDLNGEEISILDKSVDLYIEDVNSLQYKRYPLYNLFALFTNPKSNDPNDLINKIKIVNPNDNFNISITGLLIYGKVQ